MSPASPASLIPALEALAIQAGRVVMAVYDTPFRVSEKADASQVTEADMRAEAVILEGLRLIDPGVPVVAEEEVAAGRIPDTSDLFYLVDPLDGTREFVSRNGEFTINIARIAAGVPVAGVVYAPAQGVLYSGATGAGARRRAVCDFTLGPAETLRTRPAPAHLAALASRSHADPQTERLLNALQVRSCIRAGSSLKFGRLAEGVADLYPRFGRTMEWDTAAGDAILRAAGGIVVDLEGVPLLYGLRAGADPFGNPPFIALGDPALARRVCAAHVD